MSSNSARVSGIDRKWFACVFDVIAVGSHAVSRSLSFKNLSNSQKIKSLTENPLLVLTGLPRVSKFSDFNFFESSGFFEFSDYYFFEISVFNDTNLSLNLGAGVQNFMLAYLITSF